MVRQLGLTAAVYYNDTVGSRKTMGCLSVPFHASASAEGPLSGGGG